MVFKAVSGSFIKLLKLSTKMDEIKSWKRKYGRIFKINLENKEVYYRPLLCREIIQAKDASNSVEVITQNAILNDVTLKLPGSYITLASHVMRISSISDEDDLIQKAIENRLKIRENFTLHLITKLCVVFPYKPDELMDKTLEQLMELVAIAEEATGKHIILTGDEKKNFRQPSHRESSKFSNPPINELMDEASNALQNTMKKYGKNIPKFHKPKKDTHLSDLHRQMRELKL